MVLSADSTVAAIRKKVRRLTASASESALSNDDIDQAINVYYSQDFPYSVKIDQMRSVYTFYTAPNIDRYPLNVNYNQGIRSPVYFEGIQGSFFKDRAQFYNIWPRWPTKFQPESGDGVKKAFSFTLPGPFLSREVVIGTADGSGNPIRVGDNGSGRLLLEIPKPVVSVPPALNAGVNDVPGMKNINTANPGDLTQVDIGSVDYVSGAFTITFPVAPGSGEQLVVWVSQYQVGRSYSLLFWNNEFTVRPVPDHVYKVEVETYLTPVQFMQTTDVPILTQWWQLIAYGAAIKILQERQDMDGVRNLSIEFDRQEAMALERQAVEEIGQRNTTLYTASQNYQGGNWGNNGNWY